MIEQILTWRGLLDIFLMTAVLYFLYRTLIRLGTWKIVSGVLIAVAFFIMASYIDLIGIEWIFKNVSQVAVIGVIVLFQPELRKMFERAASMQRTKSVQYDENISAIITESMWKLASKRTGALLVIPGRESLNEWLNGGYQLAAMPSVPLVMSIFDPNSPGHDGALVVKKGRFSSFGVRLPVSQSGRLSEEYGTRHQSAMGLSEKSDALIIVVSEERGKVSVFHKGRMTPMNSEDQIFEVIGSHYGKKDPVKGGPSNKRIAMAIPAQIFGSFVVALILWTTLIASEGEMLEKVFTVPVEYTATPEKVVMIGEKPKDARLHLSGSKSDLYSLTSSDLSVKIDLAKAVEGKQTFLISDENIRLPKGVQLLDADPSSVEITIAKLVKKEVDIKPQLIGRLPAGFILASVEVKPEKVMVMLPSEETGINLTSLTTTPIYLEGIRENITVFCKIISPPSIHFIDKRLPDVNVVLSVKAEAVSQSSEEPGSVEIRD